jgi:hypothetical protein
MLVRQQDPVIGTEQYGRRTERIEDGVHIWSDIHGCQYGRNALDCRAILAAKTLKRMERRG